MTTLHAIFLAWIFIISNPGNKSTCPKKQVSRVQAYHQTERIIHIKDFGGRGDDITNNTVAFQRASAYLQKNGGTLIIDSGIYIVGRQKLTGSFGAGASYFSEPVLSFKDAQMPITIKAEKATLRAAPGLKFGSFNPVSGKKDSIRRRGNMSDYYAWGVTFISSTGCASIAVSGLTLDGNSETMDIGPAFGDVGIQLPAVGISLYNNKQAEIEDCYIHHCALDAIIVAWPGLTIDDPIYPHTIRNVRARFNGRQGISWVGGNNLSVIDCEFSSTGKTINDGKPVISKPSAGIDIEIENSIIRNGFFENCLIYDNAGPGLSSIGHTTYNINFQQCTFIGTTNSAAYPKSEDFSFVNCKFVGKVERIFGSKNITKAISFTDCLFTMDTSASPNGKVFGEHSEFYEGENVIFDNCVFNAADKELPVFNQREIIFRNCNFYQRNNKDLWASAIFRGITHFNMKGKGTIDIHDAKFEGSVFLNDKKIN